MIDDLVPLRQQLIGHEGLRDRVYDDATGKAVNRGDTVRGFLTIGVGRNLTVDGISELEAMDLLDNDIAACMGILVSRFPWFVGLNRVRQRAVIDVLFNVGPSGFMKFQRFIADCAAGEFGAAGRELLRSQAAVHAPQRYHDLAQMMEHGEDLTA